VSKTSRVESCVIRSVGDGKPASGAKTDHPLPIAIHLAEGEIFRALYFPRFARDHAIHE